MLCCIAAIGRNNELGKEGKLPWDIKEDLQYFKNITIGKTIIMGRITFESLPCILPNREHIIITQNTKFSVEDERVRVIHSIKDLERYLPKEKESFIIGGGQIYTALMPVCSKLYITRIHKSFEADVYFPKIDPEIFSPVSSSRVHYDESEQVGFTFEIYERNP